MIKVALDADKWIVCRDCIVGGCSWMGCRQQVSRFLVDIQSKDPCEEIFRQLLTVAKLIIETPLIS